MAGGRAYGATAPAADHERGQGAVNITWTEYPDDAARQANRDGVTRNGQIWADAPAPGAKWVLPSDLDCRSNTSRSYVLVHMKGKTRGIPHSYSVREDA